MLDRMTPEMWRERVAHNQIEPWGDEWSIGAMLKKAVHDLANIEIGIANKKDPVDSAPIWHWIPFPGWKKQKIDKQQRLEKIKQAAKKKL